ncbi:MAG: glycosyltransferase [Candidatus Bathyarchaeia archaeon]
MVEAFGAKTAVSFVLPAYNESEVIENALERLDSTINGHGFRYEVVVVDDGSVDDTRLRALKYASRNGHVRVIGYNKNIGKGFAVKTGFWRASGGAVVFIDSDLDIDIGQIRRYVKALENSDIVVGSKWHPNSVVTMPLIRKVLSRVFNLLVRLLTGVKVSDTQTGIKAVKQESLVEVFKCLSVKRYAFDVELLALAKIFGLRVIELPVKLKISKLFSLKECWHMLVDLLGIAYRLRIAKWYQHRFSYLYGSG